MSKKFDTRELVQAALLLAVAVLLNFVAIYLGPSLKVSLAPCIVIFAGAYLGPGKGALVGGLSDVLVLLIKALPGAYFPGFTLTMALYGFLGGVLLRSVRTRPSAARTIGSTLVIQSVCSLALNTLWLTMTTGNPYGLLFVSRLPLTFISGAFYVAVLMVLFRYQAKILHHPAAS
ncbi:MAG: folate family ECF transporter S component [Clostridia bacterium]|nr:folate family ECF transporter S component [Clostridia bacterium]